MATSSTLWRPGVIFPAAITLRLILLAYGRWQDANSAVKYTDIDYLVFTDAARFVSWGRSPYDRATYRYTPLLAWLLLPTTWGGWWFEFGKALFAAGDIVAGWLIVRILRRRGMDDARALRFSSIWLLNPMVANISTRGSSEGLLAVLVVALLDATLTGHVAWAGCLLGFGVHFKIYPFIYASTIFWYLDRSLPSNATGASLVTSVKNLISRDRIMLITTSFATFMGFNIVMYSMYGKSFIEHSYTYHLTRIDHRHNFSVYNTLLHLSSLAGSQSSSHVESLAFIPQLFLAVVAIPLLAKSDPAGSMLAQTFAFVTFNKVCTSQYFLWYMVFLPLYLPESTLLSGPRLGTTALLLWVSGQAIWLQQGFQLEFMGRATFVPGLWMSGIVFFLINCWILGVIVGDIRSSSRSAPAAAKKLR